MNTLRSQPHPRSIDRLGFTNCTSIMSEQADQGLSELITIADDGSFMVSLPSNLQAYKDELERLIGKVFNGRPSSRDNLALARQMSLNWCVSKCKQTGMEVDQCLTFLS